MNAGLQRLRLRQPGERHHRPRPPPDPTQCRRRLAGRPRQEHARHPGKYTYCVAENESAGPLRALPRGEGLRPEDFTVFVMAAEPPHSVTNHVANDPEGILDSICSAMSTIAQQQRGLERPLRRRDGAGACPHDAGKGWTRHDVRNYLWYNSNNTFGESLQPPLRQGLQPQPARHGTGASSTRASRSCRAPTISTSSSSAAKRAAFRPSSPAGATCRRPVLREIDGKAPAGGPTASTAPATCEKERFSDSE